MANIEKIKFYILNVRGNNHLFWCLDIELHLQRKGLAKSLVKNERASDQSKANALIFIIRHLPDSLKIQYLSVRDPSILWKKDKGMV